MLLLPMEMESLRRWVGLGLHDCGRSLENVGGTWISCGCGLEYLWVG